MICDGETLENDFNLDLIRDLQLSCAQYDLQLHVRRRREDHEIEIEKREANELYTYLPLQEFNFYNDVVLIVKIRSLKNQPKRHKHEKKTHEKGRK